MPSAQQTRFETLDSWRGISAVLVALFHLDVASHIHGLMLVRHAWMLVDFFFVLSGFVIAHTYHDRLDTPGAIGRFALRRFGRLWPLHVAVLVPFVAIAAIKLIGHHAGTASPFSGEQSLPGLVASLFMVHAWGLFGEPVWNVPSWSISAECAAYGLFAFYCLATPRRLRLAAASALALAGLLALAAWSPRLLDTTSDFGAVRCVAGFFAGVVLSLWWRARPDIRLGGTRAEILVLAAAGAFLWLVPRSSAMTLAAPLVFCAVVHVFAAGSGAVSRAIRWRFTVLLGTLSYSIYMIHYLFSRLVASALQHMGVASGTGTPDSYPPLLVNPWVGDAITLAYLAVVITLSWYSYRMIEDPARRLIGRRIRQQRGPRPMSEADQTTAPAFRSL